MSLVEKVKSWFAPVQPLAPQMVHYQTPPDAEQQYRLHLRMERDGRGLLIINAATVLHLNQTAAEYARSLIQGGNPDDVAQEMARRYRVGRAQARADYERLREHVLTLATTVDLDPVTFLDLERVEPFSAHTSAPYRVDLALTYRMDEVGAQDPEARRRVERELTLAEWQQALRLLWDAGVPHVCFTGGEPTVRDDLADLVRAGEALGMVTGVLTNGQRLRDRAMLDALLAAGLDHLQITLVSHQAEAHDAVIGRRGAWEATAAGLRNALDADVYVVAHVVVGPANADHVVDTVAYLAGLGVPAVALSSPLHAVSAAQREHLQGALSAAQEAVPAHHMALVWDLAAPYSYVNPIEIEADLAARQVIRQHLYVEPDGDVLPAQGYNVVLGNLLRDPWEAIWDHPERQKLAE
ncbi:MAG: LLM class flavin-dependent oxidoreductase [Anaerolineae bacterium]|nr:LLM class flavin-dependent oxidoreductase [Anaerolineae bacterium]